MKCPYCNNEVRDGAKHCGQCGASLVPAKKDSKSTIIAIVIAGAIAVAVIAFVLKGLSNNKNTSNTEPSDTAPVSTVSYSTVAAPTAAPDTQEADDTSALNEEKLIYDHNDIKIYYVSFTEKYLPKFTFRIENNSDYDILLSTDNESVNDYMITTIIVKDVAAGKKATAEMVFYDSDLTDNNITKIEKLEFVLKISQANYYGDSPIDDEKSIVIEF